VSSVGPVDEAVAAETGEGAEDGIPGTPRVACQVPYRHPVFPEDRGEDHQVKPGDRPYWQVGTVRGETRHRRIGSRKTRTSDGAVLSCGWPVNQHGSGRTPFNAFPHLRHRDRLPRAANASSPCKHRTHSWKQPRQRQTRIFMR
jgi:hypothetical protein